MSKKYLGFICLLYSGIFGYVVFFDQLKLFLAPGMQIYIKLSIIPLLFIGFVLLLNYKIQYRFKVSDLVLILPLLLWILAGDGRLSSSFAVNRTTNLNMEGQVKSIEKKEEKIEEEIEVASPEIDPSKEKEVVSVSQIDFDVVDSSYSGLANYLTYGNKAYLYKGKTIRVRGFALKSASFLPNGLAAIGKYEISCCAADAGFVGFFILYDHSKIIEDGWYEVEGVLEQGKDQYGTDIMYIKVQSLKEIRSTSEEQYIYPCYAYDDGACEFMTKYHLEY